MTHIQVAVTALTLHPILLVILAVGSFSITRLIGTDSFPPIEKLRTWFYEHFPHDGYSSMKRPKRGQWVAIGRGYTVNVGTWLGELVSCPWCLGWWVSAVVWGSFVLWPTGTLFVCVPFALRAIVGLIASTVH